MANAVQAFLRVVDAQRKAERQFQRTSHAMRDQDRVISAVKGSLTGLASGLAGMVSITSVLQEMAQLSREAAASIEQSAKARTVNLTLAGGDPRIKELIQRQERTFAKTAGVPLSQAAESVFNIRSIFSNEQDRQAAVKVIAQLNDALREPQQFALGVGTIVNALGRERTGGVRAVVNKLITAANQSPVDPSQFGLELAKIAPLGGALGASDTGLAATLAVASSSLGNASEAATRIKALQNVILKKNIQGPGFLGKVEALQKELAGKSGPELQKFFGSIEAFEGFRLVAPNLAKITGLQRDIAAAGRATGTPQSAINQTLALREQDSQLALAHLKRTTAIGTELATQDKFGARELARQTAISAAIGELTRSAGISEKEVVAARWAGRLFGALPVSPETAAAAVHGVGMIADEVSGFLGDPMNAAGGGHINRLTAVLEKLERHLSGANAPKLARNGPSVE